MINGAGGGSGADDGVGLCHDVELLDGVSALSVLGGASRSVHRLLFGDALDPDIALDIAASRSWLIFA